MDLGTSRLYRAPGEPGHQHQAQRWFNTSDITAAHQNSLLKQLNQQRHQERFCDCSVLVEGQLFRAHRNVLFASSGYFRMLLSHQQGAGGGGGEGLADDVITATATFDAFSPETFAVILDFIYSGQLELSGHNVIEVMSAASYLQMNNVISYCKSFIKSSLDISIKEEEEERCLGLPEVCGFTTPPGGGAGDDASSDHQQQQQRAPCSSVSPPPALWTHDNSRPHTRSQPAFLVKDPDGEAPSLEMKVESTSPAQHDLGRDEDDDLHDPHDPLFTLPGSERRRGRGGAAKRRAPPYSSRSSSAARREALELQEARAQKAEKAEELYATLPTILGFIGNFNKDTNPSMRFKCPFCTHTVKRKADLKRHLRCHTGERPYPCQACNKRFTRLEHLRSHVETIHQARKLVCRKCKCPVTEETGHVVCEGTRRYRMCTACVQEVGCGGGDDNVPGMMDGLEGESGEEPALLLGVDGEEEGGGGGDTQGSWVGDDDGDDDLAEDSGADLIIQEVDDSDVELQ